MFQLSCVILASNIYKYFYSQNLTNIHNSNNNVITADLSNIYGRNSDAIMMLRISKEPPKKYTIAVAIKYRDRFLSI